MQVRTLGRKVLIAPGLVLGSIVASPAFAAADAAFTSAMTQTMADIAIYGAALVGAAAVGVGFMIAMKYVKKIPRAA
jgi:hypothetical protein